MSETLTFACACGQVEGQLDAVSAANTTHLACYCDSCRMSYAAAGLDAPNRAELLQIMPHRVRFTKGLAHIAPIRLTPKGVLRWRATCCGTPLGTTPGTPKVPLFGLLTDRLTGTTALGPLVAYAFVPQGDGKTRHDGFGQLLRKTVWTMLKTRLSGRWKTNPFFEGLAPIKAPELVTRDARAALKAALPPAVKAH